jgi:hypothetical protein
MDGRSRRDLSGRRHAALTEVKAASRDPSSFPRRSRQSVAAEPHKKAPLLHTLELHIEDEGTVAREQAELNVALSANEGPVADSAAAKLGRNDFVRVDSEVLDVVLAVTPHVDRVRLHPVVDT